LPRDAELWCVLDVCGRPLDSWGVDISVRQSLRTHAARDWKLRARWTEYGILDSGGNADVRFTLPIMSAAALDPAPDFRNAVRHE
jgi:hypothetical protein